MTLIRPGLDHAIENRENTARRGRLRLCRVDALCHVAPFAAQCAIGTSNSMPTPDRPACTSIGKAVAEIRAEVRSACWGSPTRTAPSSEPSPERPRRAARTERTDSDCRAWRSCRESYDRRSRFASREPSVAYARRIWCFNSGIEDVRFHAWAGRARSQFGSNSSLWGEIARVCVARNCVSLSRWSSRLGPHAH